VVDFDSLTCSAIRNTGKGLSNLNLGSFRMVCWQTVENPTAVTVDDPVAQSFPDPRLLSRSSGVNFHYSCRVASVGYVKF
jgi:hypothetical protein